MIRGIKGIDILKLVTDLSRRSRGRTGDSVDFGFTKIRNTAGKTVRRKLFRVGDAEPGFSVAYSFFFFPPVKKLGKDNLSCVCGIFT